MIMVLDDTSFRVEAIDAVQLFCNWSPNQPQLVSYTVRLWLNGQTIDLGDRADRHGVFHDKAEAEALLARVTQAMEQQDV